MRPIYPFTAIVGQELMKRALILNAINPSIGGVLIRGEKGTAKSTAARALAALLPEIDVVADSPFNDDPHNPRFWSDALKARVAAGEEILIAKRQIPLIDLPVSATEDRVVGTLDIEKAIKRGEKHFEPGVLAAANRGILYVDEVNLLDDHIVDLLLDSAAMGVNVVEREGISFQHPAKFILVGTMNPEEGDLRPQLLDRFALSVNIQALKNVEERMQILERHIAFDSHPEDFYEDWAAHEQTLAEEIVSARELVDHVAYAQRDLYMIANLTARRNVDGHRADLVILKAARANAAFMGREAIELDDIKLGMQLALNHRMKRSPFSDATLNMGDVESDMDQIESEIDGGADAELTSSDDAQAVKKKVSP